MLLMSDFFFLHYSIDFLTSKKQVLFIDELCVYHRYSIILSANIYRIDIKGLSNFYKYLLVMRESSFVYIKLTHLYFDNLDK